jgi:hypothetical protein
MGAGLTDVVDVSAVLAAAPDRRRRRIRAAVGYLIAGLVLSLVYLRLSMTSGLNSDSANILLMGWDMLHGHLLMHGWWGSDVSFYSTELPQYALLIGIFGLKAHTAHIAASMTYTLTFLLAVALARAGAANRRSAVMRTLIAGGIMLAPQFGLGVFALDLSVGHIGTSVPLLLIWLLLDWVERDRAARARWWVPVAVALLLAWVLLADPIVLIAGIGPLALAGVVQFGRGVVKGRLGPRAGLAGTGLAGTGLGGTGLAGWVARGRAQWYPLSLAIAAGAGYLLTGAFNEALNALGGMRVSKLPFYFTPLNDLHNNLPAAWKVFEIFGANWAGLTGVQLALAFLHVASVAVVLVAVLIAAWRFLSDLGLVEQVLASAIVVNVVLYMLTNASALAAHEVAIIVPFGAVLAARLLPPVRLAAGTARAVAGAGAAAAGVLVLAGYTAGLGWELAQPAKPMANIALANWLEAHHLTYGLGGYWTSSSVTVDSGGKVDVRALMQYTMKRDLWMSDELWYRPSAHYANFIVLDSQPGYFSHWEPVRLIHKYFGTPAKVYHTGPYTIEVWNRNLLTEVP